MNVLYAILCIFKLFVILEKLAHSQLIAITLRKCNL